MRRCLVILALALSAVATNGCTLMDMSRMSNMMKNAKPEDYGPPPPENHREQEQKLVLSFLKDPDSAKFASWSDRAWKTAVGDSSIGFSPILVWETHVDVNAKNSYGGYNGFKRWRFGWSHGKIVAFATTERQDNGVEYEAWAPVEFK